MTEKFDAGAQDVSPRDAQKGGQGALSARHPETALRQDAPKIDEPPILNREITQGLSSDQIALLCEIEARDVSEITEDKKSDLERLCSEGYVSSGDDLPNSHFKLTHKGLDFLGKRGAGINEA